MQVEFFGQERQVGNQLGVVHYERVVEALGGYGKLVEKPEEIKPAIERALQSNLPACVNVLVDPQPKSPGLITFFVMETMLGKQTFYDRMPGWIHRLRGVGLDVAATQAILRYLDRKMHGEMD